MLFQIVCHTGGCETLSSVFQPISGFCLVRWRACALNLLAHSWRTTCTIFRSFRCYIRNTYLPTVCMTGFTDRFHLFLYFVVPLCSTFCCRASDSSSSLGFLLCFRWWEGVANILDVTCLVNSPLLTWCQPSFLLVLSSRFTVRQLFISEILSSECNTGFECLSTHVCG